MSDTTQSMGITGGPMLDTSNNQRITRNQFSSLSSTTFSSFDLNGDGVIDQSEYQQAQGQLGNPSVGAGGQPLFGVMDLNRDDRISPQEWFSSQSFATLDRNGDGVLDASELATGTSSR
jgi:Ca2+-binding EF-hand superfamily protein